MRSPLSVTRRELIAGAIAPALASCTHRKQDNFAITVLYADSSDALFAPDWDQPAKFLVFMPLVVWNRRGELEGRLAESWEHSHDFRTWTIRLRDGIRWHDGMPVTAYDVKFTFDLLQHPETLLAPSNYSVKVLDDRTYAITYDHQYLFDEGALNGYFSCWPKHLLENLDPKQINTWYFWKHPVGCGPYRHVRTVPQTMMEFEANSDYFRGKPRVAKVILKFGGSSAIPELLSGDVDAVCGPRPSDIVNISRNHRFRAHQNCFGAGLALYWNVRHPFFRDAAVRRALTFAINRRELLQVLNLPVDAHPMDFVRTDGQAARGDFAESNPYNPELAGRLLDQAGWVRGRRALRERDAQPLRFKALIASSLPESLPSAVYVQDQFKRLGVRMDITVVSDYSQILERYKGAEFEAMIAGRGAGNLEKDLRGIGYTNPVFFELLEKAKAVFDPKEKEQLHAELTSVFKGDLPLTFLHPFANTTIASTRIRGLDGSPYRGDLTQCMDELWLEDVA